MDGLGNLKYLLSINIYRKSLPTPVLQQGSGKSPDGNQASDSWLGAL